MKSKKQIDTDYLKRLESRNLKVIKLLVHTARVDELKQIARKMRGEEDMSELNRDGDVFREYLDISNKHLKEAHQQIADLRIECDALQKLFDAAAVDACRYRWLRDRDIDAIDNGGVFAGLTPDNVVINGEDLDAAIDAAMEKSVIFQVSGK